MINSSIFPILHNVLGLLSSCMMTMSPVPTGDMLVVPIGGDLAILASIP